MAVGQELLYLERKENELMEYMENMVKEGDTSLRDRRRMIEESGGTPTVEVKNEDTKKMNDMLGDSRNSLETLSESLKKLKNLN